MVLAGDLGVLRRLAVGHLGAMALRLVLARLIGHGDAFTVMGSPATMKTTSSALGGETLIESAGSDRERRGRAALSGTMPSPTSLLTAMVGAPRVASAASNARDGRLDVVAAEHQIGEPERQAVDQDRHTGRRLRHGAGEIDRGFGGEPAVPAHALVRRDARRHLVVTRLRRGDDRSRAAAVAMASVCA